MQNAKDTFYIALRDRMSAVNPARTVIVRGQVRPAVVVEENELPAAERADGVFYLRWKQANTSSADALPLDLLLCEVRYSAQGGEAMSVLARGREIAAMDAELDAMLQPTRVQKTKFTASGNTPMQTNVFWCETGERTLTASPDTLTRTASVLVMAYREDGE